MDIDLALKEMGAVEILPHSKSIIDFCHKNKASMDQACVLYGTSSYKEVAEFLRSHVGRKVSADYASKAINCFHWLRENDMI